MKKIISPIAILFAADLYAQVTDNDVDAATDMDGGAWYTSPWVWVFGAAIFILVLVALTRKGNRNDE